MEKNVNDLTVNQPEELTPVTQVTIEIPNTEELGKLKTLNTGFNLNPKYRTKEEWIENRGKPVRAFFLGIKELPNEDGEAVTCGVFSSETEIFFAGQKVLVDAVRKLEPKTPVEITFLESRKNKTNTGVTMIFQVKLLN